MITDPIIVAALLCFTCFVAGFIIGRADSKRARY